MSPARANAGLASTNNKVLEWCFIQLCYIVTTNEHTHTHIHTHTHTLSLYDGIHTMYSQIMQQMESTLINMMATMLQNGIMGNNHE